MDFILLRDSQCSYFPYVNIEIESKHKAYNIILQAIVILNIETFSNRVMGYRNSKVRDLSVKALLTELKPSSCMWLSYIYWFAYMDHGSLKCHVLFSKDHFQRETAICQIQLA